MTVWLLLLAWLAWPGDKRGSERRTEEADADGLGDLDEFAAVGCVFYAR